MSVGFQGWRLVTVHPVLVHATLGTLPLVVLAYFVAAMTRSERWTFVADVALWITTLLTFVTLAFGVVSNAVLDWPGGLGNWRWLHLGFGIGSTVLLAMLSAVRLAAYRGHRQARLGTAFSALLVALVVGFTGWIGGEVLVYRGGMAVDAAGEGALAFPISRGGTPHDIAGAMDKLRADWGIATAELASAIVEHPTAARFSAMTTAATGLQATASWLAGSSPSGQNGRGLGKAVQKLSTGASALEVAARHQDIVAAANALGDVTRTCASCHVEQRWSSGPGAQQASAP